MPRARDSDDDDDAASTPRAHSTALPLSHSLAFSFSSLSLLSQRCLSSRQAAHTHGEKEEKTTREAALCYCHWLTVISPSLSLSLPLLSLSLSFSLPLLSLLTLTLCKPRLPHLLCFPIALLRFSALLTLLLLALFDPSLLFCHSLFVNLAQNNLSLLDNVLIVGKLVLVWDPSDDTIVQGWAGITQESSDGRMASLAWRQEAGFMRAHPQATLDAIYGFLGPLCMQNSFREDVHWTRSILNGVALGTANLPVQIVGSESIAGKIKTLCGINVQKDCVLVVIRDEDAMNWAMEIGASVLCPASYDKDGKLSEPAFGSGPIPDVSATVEAIEEGRLSHIHSQITNLPPSVMKDQVERRGEWQWVATMFTLAINLFETRAAMAQKGQFKLFVVPITNANAQSVTLLCLILAILDGAYAAGGPIKTTLDSACLLVFPRLARLNSCGLQTCFNTHSVVAILEIHVRAFADKIKSSCSYSILTDKPRSVGRVPKASSLAVSKCPCTLSVAHQEVTTQFMKRLDLPRGSQAPASFEEDHVFDLADPSTLVIRGPRLRALRPSMKGKALAAAAASSPSSSSVSVSPVEFVPPCFALPYRVDEEAKEQEINLCNNSFEPGFGSGDDGDDIPVWDPSSIPVPFVEPFFASSRPPSPQLGAAIDAFFQPIQLGDPVPVSEAAELFDYEVPSDFIATLDHLKRLEESKAKAVAKLDAVVEEAANKGIRLTFSFTR
jgi:hypothetical protein